MNVHVCKDGKPSGPFTLEQVQAKANADELRGSDLAWVEGWADWQPLLHVPGFVGLKVNVFVHKNGAQQGPFTFEQIRAKLAARAFDGTDPAWIESWSNWQTLSDVPGIAVAAAPAQRSSAQQDAPTGTPHASSPDTGEPFFFYISKTRLVGLAILSSNVYLAYWAYRNWRYLKERDGLDISPFWRAAVWLIFAPQLFRAIRDDEEAGRYANTGFSPDVLAAGVIGTWVFSFFSNHSINLLVILAGFLSSTLVSLWLLPIQRYVNRANEARPSRPRYHQWTIAQVLLVALGLLVWYQLFGALFS